MASDQRFPLFFSFAIILISSSSAAVVKVQAYDLDEFRQGMLKIHNRLRYTHGALELKLNASLNQMAQELANWSADEGEFPELDSGESVFMACTTFDRLINSKEVVEAWYDEVCSDRFSFDKPDNKEARAFTQIIWKDSKQIGVGKAIRKDTVKNVLCIYVVAVYRPPGNVEDHFESNVSESMFNRDQYCSAMKAAKQLPREDK